MKKLLGCGRYYLLFVLWIIVTTYNLFKPYHMDDTAHLVIARWIIGHPLHPMSGILNWSGTDDPIHVTNQPHLYFYLLAGWIRVFGYSEFATHLFQSLFSLACVVLFYKLSSLYVRNMSSWLTAVFILGPAFLVEQNLMVDVPLLATWLCFFWLLVRGIESPRQTKRYLWAALICSAAILIKYSSLVLFVILCLSLILERRKRQFWTALIPLGVVTAWSLFNYVDYGGIHITSRLHEIHRSLFHFLPWIATLGALTPMGLLVLGESIRKSPLWRWALYAMTILALCGIGMLVAVGVVQDSISDCILCVLFLINGTIILLAASSSFICSIRSHCKPNINTRSMAPVLYLGLWLVCSSIFYIVLAPFIASRHVLLILPPVLLLLALHWRDTLPLLPRSLALGLTMLASLGLGISDWQFANFYKIKAAEIAASLPPHSRVWASGHWGWQWYAELNGMPQIDVDRTQLKSGDYLAVAVGVDYDDLKMNPPLQLIRTYKQNLDLFSLACTARRARFYCAGHGLSWSFSRHCGGEIDVYQVR